MYLVTQVMSLLDLDAQLYLTPELMLVIITYTVISQNVPSAGEWNHKYQLYRKKRITQAKLMFCISLLYDCLLIVPEI